jgi:hypothetical protein
MHDFIEVYPGALDGPTCRRVIDLFEASGQAVRGQVGSGVDTSLKDSYDIAIDGRAEWQPLQSFLVRTTAKYVKHYARKYPFVVVGALSLRLQNPQTGEVFVVGADNFASLGEPRYGNLLNAAFRFGPINLQKYLDGRGGYPHWHSEVYPRDASCETLHRVLLYTCYLNDVPEAGETEFYYQRRKVPPRAGSLLIAPAGFTHTHRGNTPVGSDKYIATSWVLFQRAETMYGRA